MMNNNKKTTILRVSQALAELFNTKRTLTTTGKVTNAVEESLTQLDIVYKIESIDEDYNNVSINI